MENGMENCQTDKRKKRTEILMALRAIASFVVALFACGFPAIHADVNERFAVHIRLRVEPSLASRRMTDRLKSETEAIWEPYGVRLEWTDDAADPGSAASSNGLSLNASLERQFEQRVRVKWPPVLGRVEVSPDASNWRSIRLSADATESVLARRTTGRPAMAGIVLNTELARALGRVLAHEIGHVLLGPPFHDPAGLMRGSFPAEELRESDRTPFRLTCSSVDRLGDRLVALRGDPQLVQLHNSTTFDFEGFLATRSDSSVGASCIPVQSAH
jgi:hypothetical protein